MLQFLKDRKAKRKASETLTPEARKEIGSTSHIVISVGILLGRS